MYILTDKLSYILSPISDGRLPYIIILSILISIFLALVALILLFRKKEKKIQEDAIGGYYSDLSADEIISCLKNVEVPKTESEMTNKFMEINRIMGDQAKKIAEYEKKFSDYMQMQGTVSENMLKMQDESTVKFSELQEAINKKIASFEDNLNKNDDNSRQQTTEAIVQLKNHLEQIEKDLVLTQKNIQEKKAHTDADFSPIAKNQEILSDRLTTLNEHLNVQKKYFEAKVHDQHQYDQKLLMLEKDMHLFKNTQQNLQAFVQDQLEHIQHGSHTGGSSLKEFGDLIKEKISNFFEERKQHFQKMEIQIDELKNLDSVKQNVLMRLQKEFSDRLTNVNARVTDQNKTLSDQLLHAESTTRHLLELEKAINELRLSLQGKQTQFFHSKDLRVQAMEDRLAQVSEAIDRKQEEIGTKHFNQLYEKQEKQINFLTDEINKLRQHISIQQSSASHKDTPADIERQMKDLKSMVYSLIDSLKE